MTDDYKIRIAKPSDSTQIMSLIDRVFHEYDDEICPNGAESDLLDLNANYFDSGGTFWVLEKAGVIFGSHGALPIDGSQTVCKFRRLYLEASLRGTDWGSELMKVAIDWAKQNGFCRIEFWSDTRFHRAHRFFEKFGFVAGNEIRSMDDGAKPYQEKFFSLDIGEN